MLRIAGIEPESIVDGPGLRVVIFCQGCLRNCEGCHNPQTWDVDGGTEMTVEEVLKAIKSNPLCRGVTYSGGEPFLQAVELSKLTRKLTGYEVAVYSGFTVEELLSGTPDQRELLSLIDVLIDGPYIASERTLELSFRGSGNQRILNVPESLKAGKAVLETSTRWV